MFNRQKILRRIKSKSIVLLHFIMKMLQIIAGAELFSYINLKVQLIQIQRRALEH